MIAIVVFWVSWAMVAYVYLGYPVLIWVAARVVGANAIDPPALDETALPTMTLILAAFNEEAVLDSRLRNALAMNYPADKFAIVIGSDGSTDQTAMIARCYEGDQVRVLDFPRNRGKASVLNDAVAVATGDILLMSDANTEIHPDAAHRLARWFQDDQVGAVVGRLILVDPTTGQNSDGLYWRYETFLKRAEARVGALLGANGALYALRRDLYQPIPAGTIIDDFVIPLEAKQRTGCQILYDPLATAVEATPAKIKDEFWRRTRIGAGGYQSLGRLWRLLDPRWGWTAVAFFSHKVLRWMCPFFLLIALGVSGFLAVASQQWWPLIVQLPLYLLAGLPLLLPERVRIPRVCRLPTLFVGMNLALLVGFGRWIMGRQSGAWERTARISEPLERLP